MQAFKKKPDVDIILDVLKYCEAAFPQSAFVKSLHHQYIERGSLSRKQLQGLHSKAGQLKEPPLAKLATLQAIILKMPERQKSEKPQPVAVPQKDAIVGQIIKDILALHPQHKRVLFYQARYQNNEVFTATEKSELEKFARLLLKK
jgi:hypothetical protein